MCFKSVLFLLVTGLEYGVCNQCFGYLSVINIYSYVTKYILFGNVLFFITIKIIVSEIIT